ncbi:alginate O-acetyltransferase AlgX-related protein [Vreelandella sp. TE19]
MSTTGDVKRWLKRHWPESSEDTGSTPVFRWELDYPSTTREPRFVSSGRVVQGWVLLDDAFMDRLPSAHIVAQWESTFELRYPLEVERPDVIERVLEADPDSHPQCCCGFRFTIPPHIQAFSLCLELQGKLWLLQSVDIANTDDVPPEQALKVLEGKQGWLFLDNDTNNSVDQYRGRLLLTDEGLEKWQTYLSDLNALAKRQNAKSAVIVAPSKESVMGPRYHPVEEGSGGPIHQLLTLPGAAGFVYPANELKALNDDAFIQTDTHWTHRGAMVATKALAQSLGLSPDAVNGVFEGDRYRVYMHTGDLGSKFSPEKRSETEALKSFGFINHRYFDNGLPNFGRLLVIHYEQALVSATCVVFGSSSSYSMLSYLSRLFTRIVFVHSAGNLDPDLVDAVKPEYLVVQTNARFVVQVPKPKQALKALIEEKRARLTPEEKEQVTKRQVGVSTDDALIQSLGLTPWVAL